MIEVGGFAPLSTTDYPDALAAVVFARGCPWRCGYCHNPQLQRRGGADVMPWPSVLSFLARRRGLLDAVVFSGGEPTADPGLGRAIDAVRRLRLRVGLHTAGIYPRRLASLLPRLDWVGIDIKAPRERYTRVTQRRPSGREAFESLGHVLDSGIAYEVRTTWHPQLVPAREILELAHWLRARGVRCYALQEARALGAAPPFEPHAVEADLARELAALFPEFILRRAA